MNLLLSFHTNVAPSAPQKKPVTNFHAHVWTQIYLITFQVKIILHHNFETMCKFNMKLCFVNSFLNHNTNSLKTSTWSVLLISSKVLNELLSQGHDKCVKVWLQRGMTKVNSEIGNIEIKANNQLLDDEINIVNTVSAPSAKASRSNGPRSTPGTAVQKEEWDSFNYAHTHAHIYVCVYIHIYI